MSRSTISTFQLFAMFPDEASAREYLESRLWPKGPVCPQCQSGERITARSKGGFKHCNACKFDFTVRTGTIFGRSHIPLHKWVYAMYLVVTARKGISSLQLAKEIGVTQQSAWFMLQRLREACSTPDSMDKLRGIVEIDEAFFGGKESNRHEWKKKRLGRGPVGKTAVLGMRERGGRVRRSHTIESQRQTVRATRRWGTVWPCRCWLGSENELLNDRGIWATVLNRIIPKPMVGTVVAAVPVPSTDRLRCLTCNIPIHAGTHCYRHRISKTQKARAKAAAKARWDQYRSEHFDAGWWASLSDHERADWLRERARSV